MLVEAIEVLEDEIREEGDAFEGPINVHVTPQYPGDVTMWECVSAWNKDPVFGVIGIQSGPRR